MRQGVSTCPGDPSDPPNTAAAAKICPCCDDDKSPSEPCILAAPAAPGEPYDVFRVRKDWARPRPFLRCVGRRGSPWVEWERSVGASCARLGWRAWM